MIQVVCVKWGSWCAPHGARYVNNLFQGVSANLTLPHTFTCFTDNPEGLAEGIQVRTLPLNLTGWWWNGPYTKARNPILRKTLAVPYLVGRGSDTGRGVDEDRLRSWQPIDLRGWYNKMYLFKPGVLSGSCVFIDLDTVIVGNVDELFSYEGDLCVLRDFHFQRHYGSGLMAFRAEALSAVWTEFVARGCPVVKHGDQRFLEKIFPDADFFQDRLPGQTVSYKVHCQKRGVPYYARVVCFHGTPRPHEISDPKLLKAFDRNQL